MRIVIVAHGLRSGGGISVGQNIIAAIGRLAPHNRYLVTIPASLGYEQVCAVLPHHEVSSFLHGGNLVRRYFYETQRLPKLVRQFNPDVALCLGNVALQGLKIPQALLLHNPYYVYPSAHYGRSLLFRERILVAAQRQQFARDLKRIRLLLCQTNAMATRVRKTYDYQGPIHVCPNAVSKFTLDYPKHDESSLPDSLTRISNKIRLFCLTTYYSHKNLEAIVDLFDKNRDTLSQHAVVLTIDTTIDYRAKKLMKSVRKLGLDGSIVNIGPVPQSALSTYFKHCNALFMPTLLESFSGTYLEAMHFRLPIITSDFDFTRTVCGDAAIYFDPMNRGSMVNAILTLDQSSEELVARGQVRLNELFQGWDDVGSEIIEALGGIA